MGPRAAAAAAGLWLLLPTLGALALGAASPAALVFALWLLALPLVLLGSARRLFLFWLPVALLAPLQCYLIYFFRSVPGDAVTASALHVSLGQVLELLGGFGWLPLLLPLSWGLYWLLLRRMGAGPALSARARKALAAALLLYAMVGLHAQQTLSHYVPMPALLSEAVASSSYPASTVLSLLRVLKSDHAATVPTLALHAVAPPTPQVVILVIGESVRPDHLGLNGYARNTTPELAKLGADLLSFSDVASTANYTYAAVPNIVRRELAGGSATLVSVFREAGYRTAWFSNQQSDLFVANADLSDFSDVEWHQGLRQDSDLLPLLASCLKQCGERQFIVLHMYGSHFPYDARYTRRDQVFNPIFRDAGLPTAAPRFRQELINSYDNTLLAADRFLAGVIAQADAAGKPAVVLYTSDHGENLYDDERQFFMHIGPQPTRADTMVPLLLWGNQAYRAGHPDKLAALRRNVNGKLSHLAIFPTMLDLADIQYDGKDPRQSFASATFQPGLRMVGAAGGKQERVDDLR